MNKGKKTRKALLKTIFSRKLSLVAVSFLLVILTGVTATVSWIEDVSQVEFSSDDGQETPLHIGSKILYSDAVMKNMTSTSVNLNDYFAKSGDVHLSPCYSNGEDFYFPVERSNPQNYRVGTKDDANVNYLSITFRVRSEGAATAYWFEKTGTTAFATFKDGDSSATGLENNLRVSVTVDGATNVYSVGGTSYRTVENNAVVTKTNGRKIDDYIYYSEAFNNSAPEGYYKNSANVTNKPNQGAGNNLNGNTLFTVNQYDDQNKANTVKTVTLKVWLEGASTGAAPVSGIDLSSINLNIVSGWEKTRRIYVKDSTVHQAERTQTKWLSHNGSADNTAGLFWAITGQESNLHWGPLTRVSTSSQYYYIDVPAVYNNVGATLSRRQTKNWSATLWDSWSTIFPNTFHSEVYTVYSTDFGTWEPADNVHCVYFTNSAFFTNVYDYMWDSHSVHGDGINDKVVKNAEWPGLKMTTKMATQIHGLDVYAFFYNSDYDRIIFNDGDLVTGKNQEYQTQDLWLTNDSGNPLQIVGGTFDMATLTWFHTNPSASDWSTKMPTYSADNTYLYGNFSTNNAWKKTRFAYDGEYDGTSGDAMNGTSGSNMLAKVYIKAAGDYEFIVYYNGTVYKTYPENVNLNPGGNITLYQAGGNNTANVYAKNLQKGKVYRFYIHDMSSNSITISLAEGEAHDTN